MLINSLFGILHQSGVPFLNRQFGSKTLPFSTIGSLGGLFTFANNCDSTELSQFSKGSLNVRYKLYNDIILLIHVTTDKLITEAYVSQALDHVHLFIVSEFGLNNLNSCQNADKLKSALSTTLNTMAAGLFEEFTCITLHLLAYPVSFFNRGTKPWQIKLEKYLDVAETAYGCVFHDNNVHTVSSEWQKLPFVECLNLLLTCSKMTLSPEKVLAKKLVYLPVSSANSQFLLVCCNYHPFRVFALCPPSMEDSEILSAFNRIFPQKDSSSLIKEELFDSLKFDNSIVALTAVKNSESIVYVSENFLSDEHEIRKTLSYTVTRRLVSADVVDDHGALGDVNAFFFVNKNMNCHLISNQDILISALFKPSISQILSGALIADIVDYFLEKKKK